jgi:hypothetical protein
LYYDPDVKMMVNIYIMAGREPTTWLEIQISRSQFWFLKEWKKRTVCRKAHTYSGWTQTRDLLHRGQTTKSTILQFTVTVIPSVTCETCNICRTISIRFQIAMHYTVQVCKSCFTVCVLFRRQSCMFAS